MNVIAGRFEPAQTSRRVDVSNSVPPKVRYILHGFRDGRRGNSGERALYSSVLCCVYNKTPGRMWCLKRIPTIQGVTWVGREQLCYGWPFT